MPIDSCMIVCDYFHVFNATTDDMSRRKQLLLSSLVEGAKTKTEKKRIFNTQPHTRNSYQIFLLNSFQFSKKSMKRKSKKQFIQKSGFEV